MLPPDLQWAEDDPTSFPTPQSSNVGNFRQSVDPSLPASFSQNLPLFYVDLDSEPVHYPYAYDIQVALLRTRFYYAKYMVYRPFVYKALHTPDQMTTEDAQGAAECLIVRVILTKLGPRFLIDAVVLSELATSIIPNLSKEEAGPLLVLLVTKLSRRSYYHIYDSTQPHAEKHPHRFLRTQV